MSSCGAKRLQLYHYVDYVAINRAPNAIDLIHALKPDVYVKGGDYIRPEDDPTGKIQDEEQAILSIGGRMHFTDEITFDGESSWRCDRHCKPFGRRRLAGQPARADRRNRRPGGVHPPSA